MSLVSYPGTRKPWHNPFILFLPFLFLYTAIILIITRGLDMQNLFPRHGDEIRYLEYAKNLLKGGYAFEGNYRLWNGPGYPIFLMPLVALKLPYVLITVCNAILKYLSIVFLYKSARHFLPPKTSIIVALIWGFYFLAFEDLAIICTEPFTVFLLSSLGFCLIKAFRFGSKKHMWLSGFMFAFLILTKVIFSYVLLGLLVVYGIGFLLSKFFTNPEKKNTRRILTILSIAFLFIFPYIAYTYSLTGKIYYFADSGGMQLYWMSTPFDNEYGEWHNNDLTRKKGNLDDTLLVLNHKKDMDYVNQFTGFDRDDAYRKLAFNNIKNHPLKYLRNCFANSGRLLFAFPVSYQLQKDRDLLRVYINSFFWVGMILASLLAFLNIRKLKFEINFISLFIFFYFGCSLLVSGMLRFFYIMIPLMLIWMSYVFSKTIIIKWRLTKAE